LESAGKYFALLQMSPELNSCVLVRYSALGPVCCVKLGLRQGCRVLCFRLIGPSLVCQTIVGWVTIIGLRFIMPLYFSMYNIFWVGFLIFLSLLSLF
jgi:hypothetical protein